MNNNNNNNNNRSIQLRKLHNPKANIPAVYIPCWMIQIPLKLLSHGAKMCYGRLSQWSTTSGKAYRSCPQLAQELGVSVSAVERYLKELKDAQLIGIFHPQAGGVNHFEFYDHPWMYEPINENLSYKNDPPSILTAPPVNSDGTPPSISTDININKIKEIKDINSLSLPDCKLEKNLYIESEQQRKACLLRQQCINNAKCMEKYDALPKEIKSDKSFIDILDECVTHYATQQKPQLVSPQRLVSWINREIKHSQQELVSTTQLKNHLSFNEKEGRKPRMDAEFVFNLLNR